VTTSRPPRPGRFETQVRVVLVLLVLFLAALDLMNLVLLSRTRDAAERAERERAKARGREVALALGTDALAAPREPSSAARFDPAALARMALRFDLRRIAVLDANGSVVGASGDFPLREERFEALDGDERAALSAGRAVASAMAPASGGEDAVIAAFVPVLDGSGRPVAVVAVVQEVPEIGAIQGWFRLAVAVQAAGVVIIGALLIFFGRWVSRPYRQIAKAAGEAGLEPRGPGDPSDPDDLAAAFRAVAKKLREQETAVEALGRDGGGLAELVRFAGGAATSMATGVMVLDRRGRVAALNPAAESLLGLAPGTARGVELDALGRGLGGLAELARGCLEAAKPASREVLEVRGESGRTGHLGVTVSPAAGGAGATQGALVLMSDLTEIRQVQEQVKLRDNLAAVGQLSAGIAHEFRNALGTILGYARMLEKSTDPRVHGPAGEITKEVAAVRAQIDEFLLYARPPEPQRAPVELEPLLRGCAAASPPNVGVEIAGEFGTVVGDETLLKRVFGNLIQNAADIGTEVGRPLSVHIVGRRAGRSIQVEVDDDGPGIPPESRGQVFLPFFTTRARGTGLGLALVQRTVVDLGGSVEVGEGARGGAAFRVRLPCHFS
jgi:PAS domain S-box-containing protein